MGIRFNQKLLIILILTILINIIMFSTINLADDLPQPDTAEIQTMPSPIGSGADEYKPTSTSNSPAVTSMTAKIVKWIRNLGAIVGALVLTLIGFKYMLASSADEKAQYKETLVPVLIGAVMLIGSLSLIITIAKLFD